MPRAMADLELSGAVTAPAPPCELTARLVVSAAHPLLAGHFPGAALVPGVLLLDAVRRAWQQATGARAEVATVDAARWFTPVAPATVVTLRATVRAEGPGIVSVAGEWHGEGGRVAAFTLRLARRGD